MLEEEELIEVEDVDDDDTVYQEYEDVNASTSMDVPCDVMDPMYYVERAVLEQPGIGDGAVCPVCMNEFSTMRRLYTHLFDHHAFSKQDIDTIKANKRVAACQKAKKSGGRKQNIYSCEYCSMKFISRKGFYGHRKRAHDIEDDRQSSGPVDNIVCPSYRCSMNFFTYLDLAIHVDSVHRKLVTVPNAFRIHRSRFQSKEEFIRWRKKNEAETHSSFFTRTTETTVRYAKKSTLLKCTYANTRSQTKGRRCEQCPCFIRVCERHDGEFEVVACFGHLGHEHPTETEEAVRCREQKWREYTGLESWDGIEGNVPRDEFDGDELEEKPEPKATLLPHYNTRKRRQSKYTAAHAEPAAKMKSHPENTLEEFEEQE